MSVRTYKGPVLLCVAIKSNSTRWVVRHREEDIQGRVQQRDGEEEILKERMTKTKEGKYSGHI